MSTLLPIPFVYFAPRRKSQTEKDKMRWCIDEKKEAKYSLRGRLRVDASSACGSGRMTMEYGRGLCFKNASSLLTHSTIINSFSSFYSHIPPSFLPSSFPSFFTFLPLCYLSRVQELQNLTSQFKCTRSTCLRTPTEISEYRILCVSVRHRNISSIHIHYLFITFIIMNIACRKLSLLNK